MLRHSEMKLERVNSQNEPISGSIAGTLNMKPETCY